MVAQLTDSTIQTVVDAWILDSDQAQFKTPTNSPYYGHIAGWDTSQVTDMSRLFHTKRSFNDDISSWDVSNVTNMERMFQYANAFNGDISQWNVSKVKTLKHMFAYAYAFNSDISNWNVSNVTTMWSMFSGASSFTQSIKTKPNVTMNGTTYTAWDVSNVTSMSYMFRGADVFNRDISNWNVSKVTEMEGMFKDASAFNGSTISSWNVSNVTNMKYMFKDASTFNGDISQWNVSAVTTMADMFGDATAFSKDIRGWSVSASTVRTNMFNGATLMINIYSAPPTPTPATQWFIIDQPVLVSNICFPAGTLIATNQGTVPIEKINPEIHTIRNKPILGITRTVTQDKSVVCFEKDSLGSNIPSQQTVMTKKHGILYKGKMRKAEGFVGNDKITKVAYNGEILYNVLMEEHDKMVVNNIICETLHPENDIAKLYKLCKNLNSEEQQKLVKNYNTAYKKHLIQSRNRATKTK